jgi:hypothetical protein
VRTNRQIACAAAAATLVSPGLAGAATPGDPSVDQYIEAVPTSAGPTPAAGGEERVQPLPVQARREVKAKAGSDAAALTKVATSSRYGAPVTSEPAESKKGTTKSALEQIPASQAVESGESRLVALGVFMTASLAGALAYAWRRKNTERQRP